MSDELVTSTTDEPIEDVTTSEEPPVEPGPDADDPDLSSAVDTDDPEPQPEEDATAGAPAATDAAATEPPVTAAPPAPDPSSHTPWSFRVDGTSVEVPGAYVTPEGEIRGLTVETFRRHLQANYLGDRTAWQRERAALRSEVAARDPQNHQDVILAKRFTDEMLRILDLDYDEREEALDKLKRDLPVYQAKAEAEAAKRQARAYQGQAQEQLRADIARQVMPALEDGLEEYVGRALQHEMLAGLDLDAKDLVDGLKKSYQVQSLFQRVKDRGPEDIVVETAAGLARMDTRTIDNYLLSVAAVARRKSDRIAELERRAKEAADAAEAAKRNARAVRPETAPPVVTASGSPAPGEKTAPWHDPKLSPEERREKFAKHMEAQGIPF